MLGMFPFTRQEVEVVTQAFTGGWPDRDRALFVLGCYTGFRVSELLSLTIGDVLHAGEVRAMITVRRRDMKGGKNSRTLPLSRRALGALQVWLLALKAREFIHKDDPLFPACHAERAFRRDSALRTIKRAVAAAGMDPRRYGTHSMRKTFALWMKRDLLRRIVAGEEIDLWQSLKEALGHSDIATTMRYLAFDEGTVNASVLAIGEVDTDDDDK